MFKRLDPFGNPNVGVYIRATDDHLFVPPGLTRENVGDWESAFGVQATELTIGGSTLIGSLMASNGRGAVIADFASDAEVQIVKDAGLEVARLRQSRLNAAGNNILCNRRGALVHPDLSNGVVKAVADVLDVEVVRGDIAGSLTVGTAGVATERGVLAHPLTSDEGLKFLQGVLHRPARIGTVNHGHGLVGAGMAANSAGFACGARTTGIELGRIEDALFDDSNEEQA